MRRIVLVIAALGGSLVLNAGLFSFLPLMGYWNSHGGDGLKDKSAKGHQVALPSMPRKKEKPKQRDAQKSDRKKTLEPGKSVSRQRFVMDLGPGGGSGAGVSGGGVSDGDLQQASYAEGETDEDARPITQTAPRKPKKAEAAGVGGLVRCLLTIGEDGRVADIRFLEVPGNLGFEEAIREAVKEWRYKPAMVSGMPVRQKIEQPFRF